MVKKSRLCAIFLTVIAITTGCGRDGTDESIGESERPGTLVELEYDTYESMSYEEQEGGTHSGEYAMEYFYNGLCWIWQ